MTTVRPPRMRTARGLFLVAFLAAVLAGSWATARWISDAGQDDPSAGPVVATRSPGPTPSAEPSPSSTASAAGTSAGQSPGPSSSIPQARVLFASNSTALTAVATRDLDRIVAYVTKAPTAIVVVQGHSDAFGSSAAKQRTAMDRAHVVEDYLAGRGVPHDQLSHTGFSDSRPVASGTAKPDPAADRRVDVIVRDVS